MKTLTLYAILIIFFGSVITPAFSQQVKKKPKKAVNPPSTMVSKSYVDSLMKANKASKDSLAMSTKQTTAQLNAVAAKADSANKSLAKKIDSVGKAKKTDSATMGSYKGKSFVFDQNTIINECDTNGVLTTPLSKPVAQQGQRFLVKAITPDGHLVISLWIWGLNRHVPESLYPLKNPDSTIRSVNGKHKETKLYRQIDMISKRETFNFKEYAYKYYAPATIKSTNDNVRYFLISQDSLKKYSSEYKEVPEWTITFGVLTTPFKLRLSKFSFSNNLSVGGAVYIQRKINDNWSWGGVVALSLSSVTLDANSTYVYPEGTTEASRNTLSPSALTTSTTRPAFTPSLHALFSYKTINFIFGVGADYINKPTNIGTSTNPEAGWIYNGKPWIGIGFGISLFGNNNTTNATKATPGQTEKP